MVAQDDQTETDRGNGGRFAGDRVQRAERQKKCGRGSAPKCTGALQADGLPARGAGAQRGPAPHRGVQLQRF